MLERLRVRPLAPVAQVHLEDGAVAPRALGPVQDAGLGLQGLLELLLRGGLRRRAPHREARARVAAAVDAEVAHVQLEHAALDEAEGLDAVQRAPVLVHDEVVDARACAGREEEPAAGRGHYGGRCGCSSVCRFLLRSHLLDVLRRPLTQPVPATSVLLAFGVAAPAR